MGLDFSGFNQSIANAASVVEEMNRQQEETWRAVAQANQERIERRKDGRRCGGEHCPKRAP